ncbi:hypothetical protein OG373_06225 [Streptomyces avidinii]|uniref:hypothetical protein n=1 Tax=Streptomyces avidinii TaxID=1895 RepID=UPI003868ECC0|nr:hypothetical protein OG373_06225 [Streptomyces avidinii]
MVGSTGEAVTDSIGPGSPSPWARMSVRSGMIGSDQGIAALSAQHMSVSGAEGVADQVVFPAPSALLDHRVDVVVVDAQLGQQRDELGDGRGGQRPVSKGMYR